MPGSENVVMSGIILTGGNAARLQGADKASIEVGGATLLEHALAAMGEVPDVVVVGDEVRTSRPVTWLREDPPGGGPAAGMLAGLGGFPRARPLVTVLAVDMPLVTTATLRRLAAAVATDGALLVDPTGRRQYLCAVYRTGSLLDAAPSYEERHGLSMHRLVAGLDLAEVPALPGEAHDVDSWDDLTELREQMDDGRFDK